MTQATPVAANVTFSWAKEDSIIPMPSMNAWKDYSNLEKYAKMPYNYNCCFNNAWGYVNTYEVISSPKIINLPAYGLMFDEIKVKEIDGTITIKSKSQNKDAYCASIDKTYTLKNVQLLNTVLHLGVLKLEFVDSNNVKYHKVKTIE